MICLHSILKLIILMIQINSINSGHASMHFKTGKRITKQVSKVAQVWNYAMVLQAPLKITF